MDNIEKQLTDKSKELDREYFISELFFDILKENKQVKIRKNVILRSRYESEFKTVWKDNAKYYLFLNHLEIKRLRKILEFKFPRQKVIQEKLRKTGL